MLAVALLILIFLLSCLSCGAKAKDYRSTSPVAFICLQGDPGVCLEECLIAKNQKACYWIALFYARASSMEKEIVSGAYGALGIFNSIDRLGHLGNRADFFKELTCLYGDMLACRVLAENYISELTRFAESVVKADRNKGSLKCGREEILYESPGELSSWEVDYLTSTIHKLKEARRIYCPKVVIRTPECSRDIDTLISTAESAVSKCGFKLELKKTGLGIPVPEDIRKYIEKRRAERQK